MRLASNSLVNKPFPVSWLVADVADQAKECLSQGPFVGGRAGRVASARHVVLGAGWKVSQEAIQMHGAIGMANETPLGAYFKRNLALALWLGDEDAAFGRLAG